MPGMGAKISLQAGREKASNEIATQVSIQLPTVARALEERNMVQWGFKQRTPAGHLEEQEFAKDP